ncbi:interstitial collagenase-like [Diadema antillarum]|uniref:interstitial collagenase-like n=1 Tax=Diadema antillarum TaxID=105358 RepID=UPI003A896FE5
METHLLLISIFLTWTVGVHSFGLNEALNYLQKYHYFPDNDLSSGRLRSQDSLNDAIRRFQRVNGLNVTGLATPDVLELMQMPRCGLPDNTGTQSFNRARRYTKSDVAWHKTDLTWRMVNYTPDLSRGTVENIMESALQTWADVSQLTFRQVRSGQADIEISFAHGDHRDGNPFDGSGGVLAHAYFPTPDRSYSIAGDAHFDEAEAYTDRTTRGTNLFQVAVHEFGHSLGLGHSNSPDAIMAAIYRGYVPNARLHNDDIAGIQALYGANSGRPEVEGTEGPKVTSDCIANFVAAAQTATRGSYLFNATHAFKMTLSGLAGSPVPIGSLFRRLPNNLDAAFYYERTGKTYFFKGSNYWRFSDFQLDRGYPRNIQSGFGREVPSDLDAAFVWSGNGMTYFVKGNRYYRFNFRTASVDPDYPRPLSVWNGIGTKVDAAFQFHNKATYFFTGGEYRRFDDNQFTVDNTYPRPSTVWLKCEEMQVRMSPDPTAANNEMMSTTTDSSDATTDAISVFALLFSIALSLSQL